MSSAVLTYFFQRLRTEPTYRRNSNATIQCPVEKDDYVVEQTVALPSEIPKGSSDKKVL